MKKLIFIALVMVLMVSGCNKDQGPQNGDAWLTFRLTDAPGDFVAVNVDVIGAQVIINDTIIDLDVNEGVYNLLDFTGGKDTLIFDGPVPSGKLSQVRLLLGGDNTIVIEGEEADEEYDLTTPSAQQSGLKFNVHADFVQGEAYEYFIDFDASKSIVKTGSGKFILKPVIKVFTELVSGGIEGVVSPVAARPLILAMGTQDTATTKADTVTGVFVFRGLINGVYDLSFEPLDPYKDSILADIQVKTGLITKLDTLKFK